MLSIKANWSEPHEANPSAYGKKINHIYKNIDLQFKKGSLVVRCSHVLNIPSWNQVIYIYIYYFHLPPRSKFLDKQSLPGCEPGWLPAGLPPKRLMTGHPNMSGQRSKMSAMIVGLQCHNSIAGLISQDHFKKKHSSHQQDWKTRFPFGWFEKNWAQVWNWPNGRWIFTPPSPQEVSPPNELRSLCNSCHRLLLSHARCPDKKFG